MHESWPACGGRTSVGTTPRRVLEKSRSRASGASSTISCGEAHSGTWRRTTWFHQRTWSSGSISPESDGAVYRLLGRVDVNAACLAGRGQDLVTGALELIEGRLEGVLRLGGRSHRLLLERVLGAACSLARFQQAGKRCGPS